MKKIDVKVLIEGAMKSNATAQYGFGYEALRLWTASNDLNLGDRRLEDEDINMELQHSQAIRTIFWNLLGILPKEVKEI
jgi:isoleucyl-tRNA synthetase